MRGRGDSGSASQASARGQGGGATIAAVPPRFSIRAITEADARAIAAWRYPGEYAFYDADADTGDVAELLDPARWGREYCDADAAVVGGADCFVVNPPGLVKETGFAVPPD